MGGKKKQHQDKRNAEDQYDQKQPKTEVNEKEEKDQEEQGVKFQPIAIKKVSYCPVCSMPFQLCKYGRSVNECIKFLYGIAPTKVVKYHPTFKEGEVEVVTEPKKQAKQEEQKEQTPAKEVKGKDKSVKDKYIVIDVKNRGKKNFITTVSGLHNFAIDAKDIAKKCSKKFSLSCSAVELGTIQMQGDNFQNIKQFLIAECGAKKKYILAKEEFDQKYKQEVDKRKKQKKLLNNAIKQQDEEEEPPAVVIPDKNQLRQMQIDQTKQEAGSDEDEE